ncbi:MAG TPA: hypothetical protein VFS21_29435 [Roseiflexaceae bacterium]|nr:hypothetical protein [Roseiflexaceae bacterium]
MKYVVRIMLALALALTVTLGTTGQAQAQAAKGAAWQVSITVLNVETTGSAAININFYPGAGAAAIPFQPADRLNAGAGTSYSVSSINSISAGFKGSAVISSDQRVVATVVQFVAGNLGGRNVRPLSNGFQASDASPNYLIPSVLNKKFNTATEFSIQNVEATDIKATVNFYSVENPTAVALTRDFTIKPNDASYVDATAIGLPEQFDGSATVAAVKVSDNTPANIVAAINEYNVTNPNASSVEAAKAGANTVYMPIALCNLTGPNTATSAYAVQNADTTPANVTVKFYSVTNTSGTPDKSLPAFSLAPGAKKSINGCNDAGLPAAFNGSAVIESTGGKIVAVGKVGGAGLSSAFLGTATGGQVLALPYVRWSPDAQYFGGSRQRTFIAIQNLGTSDVNVDVSYRDRNGVEVAKKTYSVKANGGKANSNPNEAGAAPNGYFGEVNGVFGGGAIITAPAGAQIVSVVRIASGRGPNATGEDYSGIPIQ